MEKLVGLFSSPKDVEQLSRRLAEDEFKDLDVRIIEQTELTVPTTTPIPASGVTSGRSSAAVSFGQIGTVFPDLDLDDELARFLENGVRDGATVVIVEVDDDEVGKVQQIMRDHNGRFAAEA